MHLCYVKYIKLNAFDKLSYLRVIEMEHINSMPPKHVVWKLDEYQNNTAVYIIN